MKSISLKEKRGTKSMNGEKGSLKRDSIHVSLLRGIEWIEEKKKASAAVKSADA